MKLDANMIKRASRYLLVYLIPLEILIVPIYLGSILLNGKPYHPFDMNGQMTIPSLLQALLLFTIGFTALLFFILDRTSSLPPSRSFMLGIAVLLLYGSVDEVFKIHLQLRNLLPVLGEYGWIPIYIVLFLLPPVLFYRDFIALWHFYRQETFFGVLGMVVFALGGFCSGIVNGIFLKPLFIQFLNRGEFARMFEEKSRVAFEELFELIGETLIVYGMLLFVAKRLESKLEPPQE